MFHYSIYTLHVEFIFYISVAGCSIFYLVNKYFLPDRKLSLLISISYMLSGFMVASSQWLLYISAASFLPLIAIVLLRLLTRPSFVSSLLFAVVFYCMITSIYVAFSITICYLLSGTIVVFLITNLAKKKNIKKECIYIFIAAVISILFSLPAILSTLDVLQHIQRGNPINTDQAFFNSNYLHPSGILTMLLPFSSVRLHALNTESSMLNIYCGILPFLLLPVLFNNKFKNGKPAWLLFAISIFFLLISFGELTPLRGLLNYIPGFSYFRNASLFRIFFLFFLLVFIAIRLKGKSLHFIFESKAERNNLIIVSAILLFISLSFLLMHLPLLGYLITTVHDSKTFISTLSLPGAITISSIVQLGLLLFILFALVKNKLKLFQFTIVADLVINTLICTPFFTVSSYSLKQVDNIFRSVSGFPVQVQHVSQVPVSYSINKAVWYNINVYKKHVSAVDSYRGPLELNNYKNADSVTKDYFNHKIIFSPDYDSSQIKIELQEPDHLKAIINANKSGTVYFLQNFYPGWKAYFNDEEIKINYSKNGGMNISVPGSGKIDFTYYKSSKFLTALALDIF
ncbi:MAG TPA: YfhO family protein, partial [Candidatus Nitrosocosmicus sp.]